MKEKRLSRKRNILPVLGVTISVVVLITAATLFWSEKTNRTHLFTQPESSTKTAGGTDKTATTTSSATSAQNNFSNGSARKEATQANVNEGTIADSNGTVATTPPESSWVKSSDGSSVIVYTPNNNQTLASGQSLSGASTAAQVNFRLIDNVSGVIAQGSLNVVNGKFSGVFSFKTTATDGRVDVFTSNDQGVESNNVSIPVRFTQ